MIYVNGDSFTEGSGLWYTTLPEYECEQLVTLKNKDPVTQTDNHRFYRNLCFSRKIDTIKVQKELRWSTKLEEITNKKVINISSEGGASMYSIMYKTMQDLHMIKSSGKQLTAVIIQLTGCMRQEIFYSKVKTPIIQTLWPEREINGEYNVESFSTIEFERFFKPEYLIASMNNESKYIKFYHDVMLFDSFIQSEYEIKPIYVDSIFHKNSIRFNYEDQTHKTWYIEEMPKHLQSFASELKERVELAMDDDITVTDRVWTKDFHLSAEIHENFAQRIAERYFS